MKKKLCILLSLILCVGLLASCAEEENKKKGTSSEKGIATEKIAEPQDEPVVEEEKTENEEKLPFDKTLNFVFSSGAGGWFTELCMKPDGTFTGEYRDSNMGESGEGYLGTVYFSHFEGYCEKVEKIDAYSYKLYLGDITLTDEQKEPWIEGDTLMVPSDAYGLGDSKELYLYVPGTNVTQFPEDFISWWVRRYADDGSLKTMLDCYALHNPEEETAFFAYE